MANITYTPYFESKSSFLARPWYEYGPGDFALVQKFLI